LNILDFVHALVAAHLAPGRESLGRVRLALGDLILKTNNSCGSDNRLAAPNTRHSKVALRFRSHGQPLIGWVFGSNECYHKVMPALLGVEQLPLLCFSRASLHEKTQGCAWRDRDENEARNSRAELCLGVLVGLFVGFQRREEQENSDCLPDVLLQSNDLVGVVTQCPRSVRVSNAH
jgi:hypothetical protein